MLVRREGRGGDERGKEGKGGKGGRISFLHLSSIPSLDFHVIKYS